MYESRELTIAGTRVHVREAGAGRPLLFLHGAGGVDSALPFLERFAMGGYRVIAPDHPGFGASPEPPWLDNIHDAAYFYLDLLDAMELSGVHLVGTSLGGWMALELAVRNTSRLASLTVIGPAGIRPGQIPTGDLFMWSPEDRVRNLVADPSLAEKILAMPQTPAQQETAMRNHFTTAKLAWEPRFFDPNLEKWLHRIRVPTHIVWGEHDRLFPLEYGRKLHALLPAARFSVLRACGHLPQVERPEELHRLVEDSLLAA